MIHSNFIKTFSVMVYHSYFDNHKCNCIHLIPTNKTQQLLDKFGFKINKVSNGFDLFCNTTSSITTLLDYISKTASQDYFEFDIKTSNSNFIFFTALPINWLGQIMYSSQNSKNQNSKGTITLSQTLETNTRPVFLGNLKVYLEDIKQNLSNNTSLLFEINFEARATQWQYYIINKNSVPLNNPTISGKESIEFNGPKNVTLPTGEKSLLFTSGETNILLSEKPKYKFDLLNKSASSATKQKNSNGKILIKGLPVPDVSRIGIIENNQQNQVTSPMYIYL
ncbi:hypothetical protein [Flavobacterium sp. N1736]|uniref:hypothetical protein n=1 Tax=Flavobacterium sp. N1736 TaxID=2986823 RepID=UPI002223EF0A|nr:hypothetical protein [Flavobacterium sp. N1736]